MKITIKNIATFIVSLFCLTSCEDYLSIPSEAEIDEAEIFSKYDTYQGYVDQIYEYVLDPHVGEACTKNLACETISESSWSTGYRAVRGDYSSLTNMWNYYHITNSSKDIGQAAHAGIWYNAWYAIRIANQALAQIDNLTNATDEQRNWIKGQAYFFRAYFHYELLTAWGSIPYVNKVLSSEELELPRFYEYKGKKNYQACTEHIVEDLAQAAELLPAVYSAPSLNFGRPTKVAALGYMAKALLYAGSPLMNGVSGNDSVVDTDYMKRAAEAAGECLKVCDQNSADYGLVDFDDYITMFATTDKTIPWTKENLWQYHINKYQAGNWQYSMARIYGADQNTFDGNGVTETPTQNFVDLFEMNNGDLYDKEFDGVTYTDADGVQRCKMWDDRDPRFRKAIYVDRDNAGISDKCILSLYAGGTTDLAKGLTPYFVRKYWPKGVNKQDQLWSNYTYSTPLLRLAEVYLIYAEAVNEGYGAATESSEAFSLTALDAVNKVRARAGQVATTATGGAHGTFRALVLNERAVELCFEEGQHWCDERRWRAWDSISDRTIYSLTFNQDWSVFNRVSVGTIPFEEKHYWIPFRKSWTLMYEGFPQNPGWD